MAAMAYSGAGSGGQRGDGAYFSLIPARIDRLPWSRFHTRLVMALGVAWILDGLEISIAGAIGSVLTDRATLHLTPTLVGLVATIYLIGEVVGALVFGRLSDSLGRRNLFMVTLGVYLFGNALTALTWGGGLAPLLFFYGTRFIAGMGIGGEYAAINSAIDELIPARYRGRVDIAVNGTYWAGAILATVGELVLLNPHLLPVNVGWRIGFWIGPVLGVMIWGLRRHLPESPRWLIMHGRAEEAETNTAQIEREVASSGTVLPPVDDNLAMEVRPRERLSLFHVARVLFRDYRSRSVLGASLMITQSFLYNAIFFTYALVLTRFYRVSASSAPLYLIFFAVGNLAGPLTIGRLFDTVGRKKMIAGTYILSGVLLAVTAFLFRAGVLNAATQTVLWCVIFFFASAGASAAYLTVSEIFPLELRAQAIALFFAIAQVFGSLGPVFYGHLIGSGHRSSLMIGYLVGAAVMVFGGVIEVILGVAAEQMSLEDIARPLSVVRTRIAEATVGLRTVTTAYDRQTGEIQA